jgi:uncharacterized membrane protein
VNPLLSAVLSGVGSGALFTVLGALFIRRKTKAETSNLLAKAADTLAHGAVSLVPHYEKRIDDLERRVQKAEDRALQAAIDVAVARSGEEACRLRLSAVEAKLADLEMRVTHPQPVTTVTTAVTTQGEHG